MSDYATVVNVKTRKPSPLIMGGLKPYWVTPSWDGKHCLISWSGSDKISKISYDTAKIVKTQAVGDHPQRIRNGFIRKSYVAGLGTAADAAAPRAAPTDWERGRPRCGRSRAARRGSAGRGDQQTWRSRLEGLTVERGDHAARGAADRDRRREVHVVADVVDERVARTPARRHPGGGEAGRHGQHAEVGGEAAPGTRRPRPGRC